MTSHEVGLDEAGRVERRAASASGEQPRVSVCVTTRNHERYIYDCLMSVVAQGETLPIELLVGDDGSTDGTGDIVRGLARRYPDFVHYYRHEAPLGACGNLQFVVRKATGPYIAHLDGDDYWLPGKLAKQVALMDENPGLSACYTNALCIDDQGVANGIFNNPQPEEFGLDYLLADGNFLNHSSLLYRSAAREVLLGWPTFLDYRTHLMLASKGNLGYVNQLGVAYRRHSNTSMLANQNDVVRKAYWEALESVPPERVAHAARLSASADFLGWVFARSVRERSPSVLQGWWKIVARAHERDRLRLASAAIANVLGTGARKGLSRVAGIVGGSRMPVLYWR